VTTAGAQLVECAADLGKVLAAVGYSPGELGGERIEPNSLAAVVLAHRSGGALATLVKLFLAGLPVPATDAAEALRPLSLDDLVELGLLTTGDGTVQASICIGWADGMLVAHDWQDGRPSGRDHVVAVAQASMTLADLTVRLPGVDVLDVGTGGGVQAFKAATHAAAVLGTDVNARALRLAEFGGALNGLPNVSWREGSLLEPVGEQTFDLITVNPPFIISPDNTYLWRDAGQAARRPGSLGQQLVHDIAPRLRSEGWATMLASWPHPADGDWVAPVRAWFAGTGCDAWVLRFATHNPIEHAETWLMQSVHATTDFAADLDRWLAFYRDQGIEALTTGAIIMQRSDTGDEYVWTDDMPGSPTGSASDQVQRVFAQRRRLARVSDGDLLDAVLDPLPGTRLDQTLSRGDGGYEPAPTELWVLPGLSVCATVSPVALPVVLELDGRRSLRELIANAVAATGFDAEQVRDDAVAAARRLIELGLVSWT
jgi:SAM-dependent methyltransferase